MTRHGWCLGSVIRWGKYLFSCVLPGCFCRPSKPEDLEAPSSHTFTVKSFKRVKPCGICGQAITREGSTCRGCKLSCHRKCEAK
ncbi:hypothetical protein KIL84_012583, partial [Mauremys mutica]